MMEELGQAETVHTAGGKRFWLVSSTNAGGPAGEIGGFIPPAGEPAFYGKVITPASLNPLLAY